MFYDRKIKYFNVYENGEKGQSAGFIKMEARNDMVSLQVQVAGLRHTDTYNCPMILVAGEKEALIGELQLERGKGIKEFHRLYLTDMGGQIGYEELEEVQVRMAGGRVLRCIVREHVRKIESPVVGKKLIELPVVDAPEIEVSMEEELKVEEQRSNGVTDTNVEAESRELAGDIAEEEGGTDGVTTVKSEAELLKEAFLAEKRLRETEDFEVTGQETKQSMPKTIQPQNVRTSQVTDKWQQLQAIYPHIRPFEDYREYLLMKPQDFVILPQKYFTLSDNSFLLHGYYNYDHLILSKESRPEGEQMYIGVPGNFYDKEKQVAIMFGFESFEGKREPARIGDFGYYMIPVEI